MGGIEIFFPKKQIYLNSDIVISCFDCGNSGHWGDDCPYRRSSRPQFKSSAYNRSALRLPSWFVNFGGGEKKPDSGERLVRIKSGANSSDGTGNGSSRDKRSKHDKKGNKRGRRDEEVEEKKDKGFRSGKFSRARQDRQEKSDRWDDGSRFSGGSRHNDAKRYRYDDPRVSSSTGRHKRR